MKLHYHTHYHKPGAPTYEYVTVYRITGKKTDLAAYEKHILSANPKANIRNEQGNLLFWSRIPYRKTLVLLGHNLVAT